MESWAIMQHLTTLDVQLGSYIKQLCALINHIYYFGKTGGILFFLGLQRKKNNLAP